MEPTDAWALVEAAPVARLATHNPDGAIDLVPITFAVLPDRTIVSAVDHKPKRTTRLQRLANIEADPTVTLLVDFYDDDWSKLWWVRIRAKAVVVADDGVATEALASKYAQYRNRRPVGPVVRMTPIQVRAWATLP
jgi:PPOX class probable F420-dependent enzyme